MLVKKLLIIIITALALTSSLYARGVTENVAREGVKGVYTYLEDLSKAEKDERIPEAKREEVVEKVYSGMTFEEAAADYIKKEESVSRPSSEPALPVKTMESAPVRTETAAPVKAEETAHVMTPQAEEEKMTAKVDETIPVTTPQIEEEKMPVQIEEKQAEMLPPEKTESISSEPVSVSVVVTKTAPLPVVPPVPDSALVIEKNGTIRTVYNYHDIAEASVVVEENMATITYLAQYIASSDIDAFMAEAVAEFPELLENVYYDVPEDGTLVIYFPGDYVGGTYYRLSTLDYLGGIVTSYIDAIYKVYSLEKELVLENVEEGEDMLVYREILSYRGLTTSVAVYSDNAVIRVPEGVSYDDVTYVAEMVCAAYPAESSLVYYDYKDGVLSLTYPEQTDEFLLAVVDVLRTEAMALIDKAAPSEMPAEKTETVKAEEKAQEEAEKAVVITETAKAEEKGVLFTVTFSYNGYNSDITVTNTKATLTIPEGISAEDIAAVAKNVADRYPSEAALITYSVENGKLVLSYPEQSGDYLKASLEYVEKEAKALLDLYPLKEELTPIEVSATYSSDVAPVSAPVVETTKTGMSALSSPSAELEKKKGGVFSYDITLSLKGKFVYYRGSDHIYPTLSFSMRDTFGDSFYLEAGVDVFAYINSDKLYAVSGVNLNAGFNVPVNNFDFYFYSGLRYQLASSTSSFKSGLSVTVGTGIDWRINDHIITGVGYEYYGSASLFTFFLKYRF